MMEDKYKLIDNKYALFDNKYFLLYQLEIGSRTLIMKSLIKDKIITNIYHSQKLTNGTWDIFPMNISLMKAMFFPPDQDIKNIPYEWEYWQNMSDDASAKVTKWKERKDDVDNNEIRYDSYYDRVIVHGYNPDAIRCTQRAGVIPFLAVSIENLCKILEEDGNHEFEVSKLIALTKNSV